ncbi:phosphodiester glycosidase family protein [bacterium]|nr:phosphodiester glycosidase family protein [bacterium]
MSCTAKKLFPLLLFVLLSVSAKGNWLDLEPGLELGFFNGYWNPDVGDSRIKILRINPAYFEFKLFNTSAQNEDVLLTARQWSQKEQLVAVINASMYRQDFKTSVSYMRTETHINNPYLSKDKTILAFGKTRPEVPDVMIIDRQCDSFDQWKGIYTTFVQSIRMISCRGKNVWSPQSKKSSIAAIAVDSGGNVLFIHSKLPYSTHEFINHLMVLPLEINRAMYGEGGPEAQLYIQSGSHEYEFTGVLEESSPGFQMNFKASPIPNVVGIFRKLQPDSE